MITNSKITLYHYNKETESYTRQIFDAHIFGTHIHQSSGNVNTTGATDKSTLVVRIPTSKDIAAVPGDRLIIGSVIADKPPRENFWRITLAGDRRVGDNPHWRLDCE